MDVAPLKLLTKSGNPGRFLEGFPERLRKLFLDPLEFSDLPAEGPAIDTLLAGPAPVADGRSAAVAEGAAQETPAAPPADFKLAGQEPCDLHGMGLR